MKNPTSDTENMSIKHVPVVTASRRNSANSSVLKMLENIRNCYIKVHLWFVWKRDQSVLGGKRKEMI